MVEQAKIKVFMDWQLALRVAPVVKRRARIDNEALVWPTVLIFEAEVVMWRRS